MENKLCQQKNKIKKLRAIADFLRLVGEKNRLKILCLLSRQKHCVCELQAELNLPQNLISHHLKVLKENNLLHTERQGVNIYYSLNNKELGKNRNIANNFLKF